MGTLSSRLVVSLVNQFSGPAKRIAADARRLTAIQGSAAAAGAAIAAQSRKLRRSAGLGTAAVSTGLIMMGRSGFQAAFGLEKTMNAIQSVGDISDESRAKFKSLFKEMNKDFPFTNAEIAGAALELFRAGFDEDRVRGALASSLRLAMAGDIERSEAADIQTNVLTAMRLDTTSEEATIESSRRVADVLAYSANRANTDVRKMGETFKFFAPMAAAAGIELESVGAMAMIMANNGIKASEAGVAMRSGVVRLLKPTKDAMKVLERHGIVIGDYVKGSRKITSSDIFSGLMTEGIMVPDELKKAIDNLLNDKVLGQSPAKLGARLTALIAEGIGDESTMSKTQLAEALQEILIASGSKVDLAGFYKRLRDEGIDLGEFVRINDVRQGSRLITLLAGDIDAMTQEILNNSYGYAEKAAKIRMKGIVGSVARLAAAYENLFVTIGDAGVLDTLAKSFDYIAKSLESMAQSNPALLKFGTYALMGIAVAGPLGILLSGVGETFTIVASSARIAAIAIGFMGRMATVGLAQLAVAGVVGGWQLLAGAIGAARLQVRLMNMEVAAGNISRLGAMAALITPQWASVAGIFRGVGVALRFAFIASGVGAVVAAIAAAGTFISNNWSGIGEMFTGIGEGFMSALGPARPLVQSIASALGSIWGWITDLVGPLDASKEEWRNWGKQIGEAIAWPLAKLGELYNLITDNRITRALGLSDGSSAAGDPVKKAEDAAAPAGKAVAAVKAAPSAPGAAPASAAAVGGSSDPAELQAALNRLQSTAAAVPGSVRQAMGQAKAIVDAIDLTSSGQKILQTLANGIRQGIPAVTSAMTAAANEVKAHVPQSPAKKGPLRGLTGAGIISEIARGMDAGPMVGAMHKAAAATRKAANDNSGRFNVSGLQRAAAATVVGAAALASPAAAGGARSVGDVHVQVTVNGTSASPQQIGSEVGRQVRNAVRETYSDGGI